MRTLCASRVSRFSALSFSNDNYPSIGRPLVLETKMDGICVDCSGCCVVAATRNYTVRTIEPPPPPPHPAAFNETLNLSFLIASEGHSLLQRISIIVRRWCQIPPVVRKWNQQRCLRAASRDEEIRVCLV